jgi:Tfp pilus assembly protein FimV
MQDLQAQLAAEQDAGARKDAELEAIYRQADERNARLADAQAPGTTGQCRTASASGAALMAPTFSDSQVQSKSPRYICACSQTLQPHAIMRLTQASEK